MRGPLGNAAFYSFFEHSRFTLLVSYMGIGYGSRQTGVSQVEGLKIAQHLHTTILYVIERLLFAGERLRTGLESFNILMGLAIAISLR